MGSSRAEKPAWCCLTVSLAFSSPRRIAVLILVPAAKRTFVISLCHVYRLAHELVDQEPNRSVMIRRKIDTRIPSPLLSAVCPPAGVKNLGGLANLRTTTTASSSPALSAPKPSWGTSTGHKSTSGSMAEILAGSSSNPTSRTVSPAGHGNAERVPTPVAPLASGPGAIASSSTLSKAKPNGPVARVEKIVGEVGKVDEGDWDVSDSE
jgi:transcriptional repressor NF-X1